MVSTSITPLTKNEVFSRVPKNDSIVYSTFDRSHRYLTAFNEGYCIPFLIDEVYPGDIFKANARHLTRLLTPIHPFMDPLSLDTLFFYVPIRLIWNNSKAFFGERRRNDDSSVNKEYQVPMLNSGSTGVEVGSIFDYAGIPINVPNLEFSALPFRAMNLCYNEWLRDENLADWLNVGGSKGPDGNYDLDSEFGDSDDIENYKLFKRAKKHDYFTSALPFQQKGAPQSLSIGVSAPVVGTGKSLGFIDTVTTSDNVRLLSTSGTLGQNLFTTSPNIGTAVGQQVGTTGSIGLSTNKNLSGLVADLQNVTGFTISDLRVAIQLQALKELDARCGTRYKEYVKGHFNVTISDATLDRPEYLGGYSVPFNIIPVANTSGNSTDPQGNLSAFGVTNTSTYRCFSKAFEEHGFVIGFACVRSTQSYQQGLNRMWSRKNKYDFYDPLLANLSEQSIKMKELLAQGSDIVDSEGNPVDEKTFGYQEAWAELRYKPNMITGQMRSNLKNPEKSLDVWHLSQVYEPQVDNGENLGVPLNQEFIEENPPVDRVVAVVDEPHFFSDNYFDYKCTREVPLYGIPSYLLGRL